MNSVTTKDISAALNTTERTIQIWVESGKLPKPIMAAKGRGRPAMTWEIKDLPKEIRERVTEYSLTNFFRKELQNGNGRADGSLGFGVHKHGDGSDHFRAVPAVQSGDRKRGHGAARAGMDEDRRGVSPLACPVQTVGTSIANAGTSTATNTAGIPGNVSGATGNGNHVQADKKRRSGGELVDGHYGRYGVQTRNTKTSRVVVRAEDADAKQLLVRDARLGILNAIERAVRMHRITHSKAIDAWIDGLKDGSMAPMQQLWCCIANERNGFKWDLDWTSGFASAVPRPGQSLAEFSRKLGRNTIYTWIGLRKEGGDDALIPRKIIKDMSVPAWAPYFLAEMQRPQQPSLATAYRLMVKRLESNGWRAHVGNQRCGHMEYPSCDSVSRWYDQKYSKLDKHKGRNTGSAMNPYKFAHKRTSDGMWPLLEVHSDGWNTHFTAPHPISGKFVTFEIWHSHDVATRKAYVDERSIGLSESMIVILGSLYAVCAQDGEPVVWQTDNTGSVKNDRVEFDPATSIAARRGMTIVHNLPGNSQANGIAENFNKYLDERAKELATYQGKSMDSLSAKRVLRCTQNMVKAQNKGDMVEAEKLRREAERAGCGLVFRTFQEAVDWVKRIVAEFNDRPHSELPKTTDLLTGKKRHMTPNEMMEQFIADGWPREPLAGDDLEDAFRVHERKTVRRGKVSIMGQEYHHAEMDHINGEQVMVAYDINDGERVWIKTMEGVLICVADFYAARGYRPRTFYEIALDKRADSQQKRLQAKSDEIEAQRPGNLIDQQPAFELPTMDFSQIEQPLDLVTIEPEPEKTPAAKVVTLPVKRPMFKTDAEKFKWLKAYSDQITSEDDSWMDWYMNTTEWEDLFGDGEAAVK